MVDLSASRVELRIDDAPGIAVETTRIATLAPTGGLIQRIENQILRLSGEVVKHEQYIEEAREEYRQAATALRQPFKHEVTEMYVMQRYLRPDLLEKALA